MNPGMHRVVFYDSNDNVIAETLVADHAALLADKAALEADGLEVDHWFSTSL